MAVDLINQYIDKDAVVKETDFFLSEINRALKAVKDFNATRPTFEAAKTYESTAQAVSKQTAAQEELAKSSSRIAEAQSRTAQSIRETVTAIGANAATTKQLSSSYDELVKASVQNQLATKQLSAARKDLDKSFKDGLLSAEDYTTLLEDIKKKETAIAVSNLDLNRAIRNTEKGFQAEAGSLNALRAELNLALQAFDRMSAADQGSDFGVELKKRIDDLTKSITAQEASTGRFQRNVGNYSGAVSVLEKAFTDVKKKIDDLIASGNTNTEVFERLQQEYAALNNIVSNQANGFVSMREEIRANQIAIEQLIAVYGEDSAAVQELIAENAQLRDSFADLQATQRTLGSDTFTFDALLQGGQALVGIYSSAQGAAALFGDESEDLQKTMVKLQAAMALVQGVQATVNALQREGALVQGLIAVRTAAAGIAMKAYAFATGGATIAARAFNTALLASGIGIVLVLISTAASAMGVFGDETKDATTDLENFNEELEFSKELLDGMTDSLQFQTDVEVLRAKKRGATEKELTDITIDGINKRKKANDDAIREAQAKIDNLSDKDADRFEKEIKLQDQIQALRKRNQNLDRDAEKQRLDFEVKTADDIRNKQKQNAEKALAESKAAAERARKADFEIFKRAQQDRIDAQKAFAEADTPQTAVRIDARLKQFEEERKLAIAERDFELSAEKLTAKEREDIIDRSNRKVRDLELATANDIIAIRKSINDGLKDDEAQVQELVRTETENRINREIESIDKSFQFRINKLQDNAAEEAKILADQFNAGLITKEQYEEKKLDIENKLRRESLLAEIEQQQRLLAIAQLSPEQRAAAEQKLLDLKRQVLATEITDEERAAAKRIEIRQKTNEKLKDLANELGGLGFDLLTAGIERQKNEIQEQIDLIEERKNKEIEAINQSGLAQQEKVNQIALIEARAAGERERLEKRKRQLDQERARYERIKNIADIIQGTAVAVVAALGSKPWTPANIALAAVVGGIGLAQIARVLATPLPKFYGHKSAENKYEGLAYVSDGGRSETILRHDNTVEVIPNKTTMVRLHRDDQVVDTQDLFKKNKLPLPNHRELVQRDFKIAISKTGQLVTVQTKQLSNDDVVRSVHAMRRDIVKAIKNKKELHVQFPDRGRAWVRSDKGLSYFLGG